MPLNVHRRAVLVFALLFVLYQGAEGIGDILLGRFWVQAAFMLAMVAAAWPLGRWLGFRGYDAYALEWHRVTPVLLIGGLMLALMAKYIGVCVGMAFDIYAARARNATPVAAVSFLSSIPWVLAITFVPSIAEDILTRGFLWRAIRPRWPSPAVFVLASATLYVANHIYRLDGGVSEWVMLFCFGLAYATAVVRTGSLWLAVGLHWGWNLANILMDDILPYDTLSMGCSNLLSAAAHLVMFGVMFAIPSVQETDGMDAEPA